MNEANLVPNKIIFYCKISIECSLSHNTLVRIAGNKMPGSIVAFKSFNNNYVLAY